jgi:heme-degrading monooxygenase HmoA
MNTAKESTSLQIVKDNGLVTLINVFTPHPGKVDAFCEKQIAEYRRLSGRIDGALGANLHRSLDGRLAANYAQFTSEAAYRAWIDGDLFREHVAIIRPLIERAEPALYDVAFTQVATWTDVNGAATFTGARESEGGILRVGAPVVTLINRFTPKTGMTDAFCAAQIAEYRRLVDKIQGVVSTNLHRRRDGMGATNYAQFKSMDAYRAWIDGPLFGPHVDVIRPFVERADPVLFELIYTLHEPGSRTV